jgi:two-component system OmpR family sensor kinase
MSGGRAPLRDLPNQLASDAASELADLRQQVAELRQAVRARDDFIAIAAHELRNPMTPIMAVAELALKAARSSAKVCPPRVILLLERMQLLSEDFVQRSTRLLDVARIETGNLRLEPSPADLSALVLSVAQRYEAAAARGRSRLELDVADGVRGMWDRLGVEQVVENLLSNALKFGIGQPVTLRLRSDDRWAQLDVRDRGVGMSDEQQARIFGRFEQVVAQHRGSGFGVGLWVAHRLVAAMGGRITVTSRVGDGSTFTVALPLHLPEPERVTHEPV